MAETHVNDGSTAVQVFVQVIQHLSKFLHVLLGGLKQHGLEVNWQPVSTKTSIDVGHQVNAKSFFLHSSTNIKNEITADIQAFLQ